MDKKINRLQVSGFHANDFDAFLESAVMNMIIDTVDYYEGALELDDGYVRFSLPFLMDKNQYAVSFSDVYKMVEVISHHVGYDDVCTVIASSLTDDKMLVNHCFAIRANEIHHFTETYGMYGFGIKNHNLHKKLNLIAFGV
jgi:hypothetical protein